MNPDSVAPRDGSTTYYSLLYCDAESRVRAMHTLRLIQTISTTLFDVTEPQVAEQKIHWWHEEIARMAKHSAGHPVCKATQDFLCNKPELNACLSLLSTTASERFAPLATKSALDEHITSDYSARLTLLGTALNQIAPPTAQTESADNAIALALGQCHRLNTLGLRLRSGYSVFSDEHYSQFETTPEYLSGEASDTAEQNSALLNSAIANASANMNHTMSGKGDVSHSRFAQCLPLAINCSLRQAQMNMWSKRSPDLVNGTLTLTPLKKFFVAYRCRRRFEKRNPLR